MQVRVVDDTPEIAQLLHMTLEHEGVHVSMTTSNFEDLLHPGPWEDIDTAIVDLRLPGVPGEQILQYLAEHHPHIRRFVLSGSASFKPEVEKIAHRVFEKPVDFPRLTSIIREGT